MNNDDRLRRLEAWLSKLYDDAGKDMRKKWDKYLSRKEKRAETLLSRVREAKTAEERKAAVLKYQEFLRNQVFLDQRYRDMVNGLAHDYANVNARAAEIINGKRAEFYAEGYNLSAQELNRIMTRNNIGVRFDLCNPDAVNWLAKHRNDMNFPTPRYLEVTRDVLWNIRNINSQVSQGIVQGEGIPKIAKRIENVTNVNKASAIRTARTVATGSQNAGRIEAMKQSENIGVKTKKKWMCTHDARTRDSHLEIDGETVDRDAEFSNGCRYPGDPIGPPEEVWNCRCTLITVVDGFSRLLPEGKENAIHVKIDGEWVR